MKKLLIATLLIGTTTIAQAQFTGNNDAAELTEAFVSPYVTTDIKTVRQMPDDTYVTVEGHILQQFKNDRKKYLFQDHSGEIILKVDDKIWRNQQVTPETKVKVLGELDQSRHPDRVKIEAVYLEVIQ